MANPTKTKELALKLLKGQDPKYFKYEKPLDLLAEEQFFDKVCRKTRDSEGKQVPLLDKHGDPVFFQLQHLLDLDIEAGTLTEEQKSVLLQDPRYKDPATGKLKTFPYKILQSVTRTMTEADGREWLKARWTWEGLNRAKQIEVSPAIDVGVYDHPEPETRLVQSDPKDKESPSKSVITSMRYQQVHDIPFSRENFEKEVAKRSAPRDEKHIVMTLQKINVSGIKYPHVYQVTDKEQFLTRPFNELWDYLGSAPLRDKGNTKMGKEDFDKKNNQYG